MRKRGETVRGARWWEAGRRRDREVRGDHKAFEEVHDDKRKITSHDPDKCNKKHVNSKERARNRREKRETTTLETGENSVRFSIWANKNEPQKEKTVGHDFL